KRLTVLAITAQFVVFGAFVGAFQRFIGFRGVLELGLGVFFLADIGVVFARQLAIGRLDGLVVGCRLHAEYLVIVFEVHGRITIRYRFRAEASMRRLARAGLTDLKFVTGWRRRSLSAVDDGSCDRRCVCRPMPASLGRSGAFQAGCRRNS